MLPSNIQKYPLCLIVWKDAQSSGEWEELDKVKTWADKSYIVHDIGWVVHESKETVVICSQIGEDGSLGNKTKIPVGWVIKKEKINFSIKRGKK